jgi:glycosidase
MKKILSLLLCFIVLGELFGQSLKINKIEPSNWWAGMKKNEIQLMIYGENLSEYKVSANTTLITVNKIYNLENKNYSFIDISLASSIKPGNYKFVFSRGKVKVNVDFPVLQREKKNVDHQGFSNKDVVYLIMPDRFADGDTSNNQIDGMMKNFKPGDPLARHGGDLQGIINHMNYFNDLGITALWLTPVVENNHLISYHGYAATDYYKIDARLGTNEKYKELIDAAHRNGIKIIYDHVANHISINHPWIHDLPTPDWINGSKEKHLNAWHDKAVSWDIHKEQITSEHLTKGWFVDEMPDLNQNNPLVKNYLIQNTIWWIEYAGFDGIREDTYPYVTPEFTSVWAKEILKEYPTLNIVGEVWSGETDILAPYQKGSKLNKTMDTNLPVVTDFALRDAYNSYLGERNNLYSIYDVLAKDYLYEDPQSLLTFVDNHDMPRAMFTSNSNVEKVKLVFTHLLTSRGIPTIFYGTEIGIVGNKEDGVLRADFKGGFPNDKSSAFESSGRTNTENNLFTFFKKLIEVRNKYKSLSEGALHHLAPINNVYIYTKKYKDETMLILLNGDNSSKLIRREIIESVTMKNPKLFDVLKNSYKEFSNENFVVEPMTASIYLVK